jgi:hypothetical protein
LRVVGIIDRFILDTQKIVELFFLYLLVVHIFAHSSEITSGEGSS